MFEPATYGFGDRGRLFFGMLGEGERPRRRRAIQGVRNSVVVAGNVGEIEADLEKANGGREIKVRDAFSVNILANDLTNSVGATEQILGSFLISDTSGVTMGSAQAEGVPDRREDTPGKSKDSIKEARGLKPCS